MNPEEVCQCLGCQDSKVREDIFPDLPAQTCQFKQPKAPESFGQEDDDNSSVSSGALDMFLPSWHCELYDSPLDSTDALDYVQYTLEQMHQAGQLRER